MAEEPSNPHDALIKALLESPERAGILLRENLPAVLLERMTEEPPRHLPGSFIDPALGEQRSDRLFEVALKDGRTAFVYVLIEHKSASEPATPVQLLGYQQRIWQRYAEQDGDGRAERYRHLPPIFPLVIYHGQREWAEPLSLMACIDADEELRDLQRDFGYQVRHLRPDESDDQLSADPAVRTVLRALAWAFLDRHGVAELERLLQELPEGHFLEKPLLRYIVRVYATTETSVRQALETTRPQRAQELNMTVADEWIERGKQQGRQEGLQAGLQEGRQEGLQEGRQEGEANILVGLLEAKFGELDDATQDRVRKADDATLQTWSLRVLTASSLEEVFGEG